MTQPAPPHNPTGALEAIAHLQARLCPPRGLTDSERAWLDGFEAGYRLGARHHATATIDPTARP